MANVAAVAQVDAATDTGVALLAEEVYRTINAICVAPRQAVVVCHDAGIGDSARAKSEVNIQASLKVASPSAGSGSCFSASRYLRVVAVPRQAAAMMGAWKR
jgi:hypothetical protein